MDKKFDEKVMQDVLLAAEGQDASNTRFAKPEDKPYEDGIIKIKNGHIVEKLGKYEKEMFEDIKKHPGKYSVQTSKGRMNLRDAMNKGWNPKNDQFDGEDKLAKKEELLGKLNPSDRSRIEELTDPKSAALAEADAEKFGVEPGSPMVKRSQPPTAAPTGAPDQNMMAALLGGGGMVN